MMKLYTEKEIQRLLGKQIIFDENDLDKLTPIELPSDDEIHKQAINYTGFDNEFKAGAKWMRDKIQGGNK